MNKIRQHFTDQIPTEWFTSTPDITVDREEILVIGRLPSGDDAADATVRRFREETRAERIRIAGEAERRYGRKVSWGVRANEQTHLFTHLSIPVMTRLRQPEREVLDTLVAAGVARSRSEALAWCVKLVADHEQDWINRLRDALASVVEARAAGPDRAAGPAPAPPTPGQEPS